MASTSKLNFLFLGPSQVEQRVREKKKNKGEKNFTGLRPP